MSDTNVATPPERGPSRLQTFGRIVVTAVVVVTALLAVGAAVFLFPRAALESRPARDHRAALDQVRAALAPAHERPAAFGLVFPRDLEAIDNPLGAGVIVFHPELRQAGVERPLIWVVVGGSAYATNGPSKQVTPSLPWPRDAGLAWEATGLDAFTPAQTLINYVQFR